VRARRAAKSRPDAGAPRPPEPPAAATPPPVPEPDRGGRLRGLVDRVRDGAAGVTGFLGGATGAIGGAAASLRDALWAAGESVRTLWFRLSVTTRNRVAAASGVLALAALIWFAAVPVLPCQFPAGDVCPPSDDASEIVPGDTLAYVHANLDPETEQYEAAAEVGARLPTLARQLPFLLPRLSGVPADFTERVRPWLGGEVALAIVPGEGGRPEQLLMFEVDNSAAAETFAEETASGRLSEADHEGVTVRTDERGRASALVGDFLLIGSETAVERTIDVERGEGRSLADSPLASEVLDALPDDSVAQAAVSDAGVAELLSDGRAPFGSLEAFVNFDATVGAGAALVASDGALEFAIHSRLDPERLESSPGFFDAFPPFEPSLGDELQPETLAYLGLGDPAASVDQLITQAVAEAPGIAGGFEDLVEDLRRSDEIDLREEVLPLLGGEAAVSIEPVGAGRAEAAEPEPEAEVPGADIGAPEPPGAVPPEELLPPEDAPPAPGVVPPAGVPYLMFVTDEVDEERARETLARLQGPLAEALDPAETLQAPVFSQRRIDGVEAHSLRLSRTVDLTYAVFDGRLVIASDPRGVAELASGEGGLADAETYGRATEGLPAEPNLLVYLNLAELIALAERAGLAQDPAYASVARDIRRLDALGLAVERGDTTLDTALRLTVGD
jgi:hypothetical protein